MTEAVSSNSEILLLYEARLCNPNGDPDRENKPRIDPVTQRNYVTDVRLKRFIRDYIIDKLGEKYIWVTTIEGQNVRADQRLKESKETWRYETPFDVPKYHYDARLFGATIPIGEKTSTEAGSYQIIGPVQFSMGYSLHKVQIIAETSTITSRFTGAEKIAERQYGTIGKDWRVYYSLIAFYGVVNAARGEKVGLRYYDVQLLDNIIWDAIMKETITRSKIGHFPLLYLRIQYKDKETLCGDLRRYIREDFTKENIRDLTDVEVSFSELLQKIGQMRNSIYKAFARIGPEFDSRFDFRGQLRKTGIELVELPHPDMTLDEKRIIVK